MTDTTTTGDAPSGAEEPTPGEGATGRPGRPPWRAILALVAVGVILRGVLLVLASPVDITSDETNYLYSAFLLEHLGVYFDQHRYLWPPGYAYILSQWIDADGVLGLGGRSAGIDALRWMQVVASGFTGLLTMLFGWRLFSSRAAVVAGVLWCIHLPLAAFTHLLFAESLFLPPFLGGLWFLVTALDRLEGGRGANLRLVLSGLCFGAALHLKEMPLYLVPALGLVVLVRALVQRAGAVEAVRRGVLVPLVTFVVLLPWTLRNAEVYGRPVVAGATLGENVYGGLNADQRNFDYRALKKQRLLAGLPSMEGYARPEFNPIPGEPGLPEAWSRPEEIPHLLDRQSEMVRRGVDFALANPVFIARTRVQNWADWATPLSFFTRHFALEKYPADRPLTGFLRKPLIATSVATSCLVLLASALGAAFTLLRGPGRAVLFTVLAYVFAAASLVAMSRFRIPTEPLLIVLASGFLAHGFRPGVDHERHLVLRTLAALVLLASIVALWWVGYPQARVAFDIAWNGGNAG